MAEACDPLLAVEKNCAPIPGGLNQIIYGDNDTVKPATFDADGQVTAFTATEQALEWEFRRESASYVETPNVNFDTGVTTHTVVITINAHGRNQKFIKAIDRLIAGQREVFIVAKANSGNWFYFKNVRYSGGEANGGMKFQDGEKEQVILTGERFDGKSPTVLEASALSLLEAVV